MAYHINDKKKILLASKEEIVRDIKYIEKRIEEARSQKTNSSYVDDDEDSDSDDIISLDLGPSFADLKLEQNNLQTCLHATQELTNLCVLQSEVNIIVNDPVYEREPQVTEPGIWREVTADCRVDLVPFSITFYTHKSSRHFGPTTYRGLRVLPVKAAHEKELAKSILPRVDTPSNAVEVLRSYAVAHRSRRTTLARLAEKYSNSLFMEPMAEGGYIMKCANLLEVSWTLENKWSPVAPFHHRMKFDLEYMDEAYVKIISQAHKELLDPTLETDERTRLMSKIIATCLEAQGPTQELYESMESDIESENLRKRRTTLDEAIEEPVNKKIKDSEIMAPPKTLPKKAKPKGKENNVDNKKDRKTIKKSGTVDGVDGAKKAKLSDDNLAKNNNVNIKSKADKDVVALKKITSNKTSNVKDNIAKTNVDNNYEKSVNEKEQNVVITKNLNKDKITKNVDNKKDRKTIKRSGTVDGVDGAKKAKLSDDNLAKNDNANIKSKADKEVVALKKNTSNKTSNVKDNIAKTNVDNNYEKSVNEKEQNVVIAKNLNKDKVTKNTDANAKHNTDKQNIFKQKKIDDKAGNIKKLAGASKTNDIKNSTDTLKNRDIPENKNIVDKQNLKGKSVDGKTIVNVDNSNKTVNNKKNNKLLDNIPSKDKDLNQVNTNKDSKLNKRVKNVEETNSEVNKIMSSKGQIEGNYQNNTEKSRINKVSSNQKNIASKDIIVPKIPDTKNKPKSKSTITVTENVSSIDGSLNKDSNSNKKNVVKSKSLDRPKSSNPKQSNTLLNSNTHENNSKLIKNDTKIVIEPNEKNVSMNSNNKNQKSKETFDNNGVKSTKDNGVKSSKTSKKENIAKVNIKKTTTQSLNKPQNNEHVNEENPPNSLYINKNSKSNPNIEKTVNNRDSELKKTKQDGTQLKLIVKDVKNKTKNSDKVTGKVVKNNKAEKNNAGDLRNLTNKKLRADLDERNSIKTNNNTVQNLLKPNNITNSKVLANINRDKNKNTNLNSKSSIQNIKSNIVNKKQSTSPHQNKIKLLNPRNKLSIGKLKVKDNKQKENDLQKDKDKNKKFTKIPQKLMSVRDQIIKKNPLRISPRKSQSTLKTDSQNSSRNSQRSIQKAITGIPRLMKKPIHKG